MYLNLSGITEQTVSGGIDAGARLAVLIHETKTRIDTSTGSIDKRSALVCDLAHLLAKS